MKTYTSAQQVVRAIEAGDIKTGSVYTKSSGMYQIMDLDCNGSGIIGHSAEMEISEDGGCEPTGAPAHITAVDLIGAEF